MKRLEKIAEKVIQKVLEADKKGLSTSNMVRLVMPVIRMAIFGESEMKLGRILEEAKEESAQKRAINSLNRKAEGKKVYNGAKQYIDQANASDVFMYSFFTTDDSRQVPGKIYILEFAAKGPSSQGLALTVNDKFKVARIEAGDRHGRMKKFSNIDTALKSISKNLNKPSAKAKPKAKAKRTPGGKTKFTVKPSGGDKIVVKMKGGDLEAFYKKAAAMLADQGFDKNDIGGLSGDTFTIDYDIMDTEEDPPINIMANEIKFQLNRLGK